MEPKMLYAKAFVKGEIKEDDNEGRLTAVIGASDSLDRHGEILDIAGADLKNFKKYAPLLWAHNVKNDYPPIGRCENVRKHLKEGTITFDPVFDLTDPLGRMVFGKYKNNFMKAFSVGFLPDEFEDNVYKKWEVLEFSAVPVPANPDALVQLRSKGLEHEAEILQKGLEMTNEMKIEAKKSVPYKGHPTAPEGTAWSASAAKKRIRAWAGGPDKDKVSWSKYRQAFTWYDTEDAENFGAYKLPHHDIVGGGIKTVWRGVAAAMAALLGARGGVNIPEGGRRGVYNHLKKHYGQFDKEVPDFRMVEEQVLKGLNEELEALYAPRVEQKKQVSKKKMKEEDFTLRALVDILRMTNQATAIALKKVKEAKGGDKGK